MLGLRFASTRYWMIFLPGLWLSVLLRQKSRSVILTSIVVQTLIALGMAIDDFNYAASYKKAATQVCRTFQPGVFAGHLGWQHYMEAGGWKPLEEWETANTTLAIAEKAYPQNERLACKTEIGRVELPDTWWGPRVHTHAGRASFYHNRPGNWAFAPWTLANDDYDRVVIYRPCKNP